MAESAGTDPDWAAPQAEDQAILAALPIRPEDPITPAAARSLEPFTAVVHDYDIAPAEMPTPCARSAASSTVE